MKKILAMMLTAAMMLSMGTAVLAEGEEAPKAPSYTQDNVVYTDVETVDITKYYKLVGAGSSPEETFTFNTLECTGVKNVGEGVTTDNAPVPTIGSVKFDMGVASTATDENGNVVGTAGTVTIELPPIGGNTGYKSVGEYTYTFTEKDLGTAGVDYYGETMKLVVTVVQDGDNGKLRIAGVHCEGDTGSKTDKFTNTYSAGSLVITKQVTGNLGDRDKVFDVTVTFTATAGDTVMEDITYEDFEGSHTIKGGKNETSDWTEADTGDTWTKVIKVKHDSTVTFTNIPYDVKYEVVESNYVTTDADYDFVEYTGTDVAEGGVKWEGAEGTTDAGVTGTLNSASETVAIENSKGAEVDTGISVDSIPYIAMLGVVAIGGTGFMVSKKRRSED